MGATYGYTAKDCKTFAELKNKNPNLSNGVYTLFPNGEFGTPATTYCIENRGNFYQAVWKTFGGPLHSTFGSNVSNSTLFSNKSQYDGTISPFNVTNQMSSSINVDLYNYWSSKDNVVWYKQVRSYNISGELTANPQYTNDIYLTFNSGATYGNAFQTTLGDIGGFVNMSFYLGDTFYDYGSTRYRYGTSNNIGFANDSNLQGVPGGESVMGNSQSVYSTNGWEARHVLSYVHSSSGRDTIRCQFRCWGSSDLSVATEVMWFVREKTNNE